MYMYMPLITVEQKSTVYCHKTQLFTAYYLQWQMSHQVKYTVLKMVYVIMLSVQAAMQVLISLTVTVQHNPRWLGSRLISS